MSGITADSENPQGGVIQKAADDGNLWLDVNAYPAIELLNEDWNPDFAHFSDYQNGLKLGGVKLNLDGSLPGMTAFSSQSYHKPPTGQPVDYHGYPAWSEKQIEGFINKAWDNDWQILMHTNADAASYQMLDAIKSLKDATSKDWRPVMLHAQIAREDQFDDIAGVEHYPKR